MSTLDLFQGLMSVRVQHTLNKRSPKCQRAGYGAHLRLSQGSALRVEVMFEADGVPKPQPRAHVAAIRSWANAMQTPRYRQIGMGVGWIDPEA